MLWILYITLILISFVFMILSLLKMDQPILGFMATVLFLMLGIASNSVDYNYCDILSNDTWDCNLDSVREEGASILFYGLGLMWLAYSFYVAFFYTAEELEKALHTT